jgi:hypothetical protein
LQHINHIIMFGSEISHNGKNRLNPKNLPSPTKKPVESASRTFA